MTIEFKISVFKFVFIPLLAITTCMVLGAELYFRARNGLSFFTVVEITGSTARVGMIFAQIWIALPVMYCVFTLLKVTIDERGILGRDSLGRKRLIEWSNIANIRKCILGLYYRVSSHNGSEIDIPAWVVKDKRFLSWLNKHGVCI